MKRKLDNVTLIIIDCVETKRAEQSLDICLEDMEFKEVKFLTSLETKSPYKVAIEHIPNIEKFSEFCLKELTNYVDTEFVFLVQWDGFILNPQSWEDSFLNYDYIGAPFYVSQWQIDNNNFPQELKGSYQTGNGGFCIRSKRFLDLTSQLSHEGVFPKYQPEDVAVCIWHRKKLEENGIRFAPTEIAARFSIEGTRETYRNQFGFHGLAWTDISLWIENNPKWSIPKYYKKLQIQ